MKLLYKLNKTAVQYIGLYELKHSFQRDRFRLDVVRAAFRVGQNV